MSRLDELLAQASTREGPALFLTGAGISAESGIPTFRGKEGYWQIGSREYRPEHLATFSSFSAMPEEVWSWYLYRRGVCRAAQPNAAHEALVRAERGLGDGFHLLTQNVDGLYRRAGQTRLFEIHGNIDFMRFEDEHPRTRLLPERVPLAWPRDRRLTAEEESSLRRDDGAWARPHVLFFDESYDEPLFRFESSLELAMAARLLVVIGTSGATTLPTHVVEIAARRGIPLVVVNADESPFSELATELPHGLFLRGSAVEHVPALVERLLETRA